MAICTGCGLRDGADGVEVATSGVFGEAPLDVFGGDDTVGAPVYCDNDGELRTVPEHTSVSSDFSASAGVNGAFGGGTDMVGSPVKLTLLNPSTVRGASIMWVFALKIGFFVQTTGFSIFGAVSVNGGAAADTIAKYWGVPIGGPFLDGSPGYYSHEDYITESAAATLTPGQTSTLEVTPRIVAGGGAGRFVNQGVGIRAMLVTI